MLRLPASSLAGGKTARDSKCPRNEVIYDE